MQLLKNYGRGKSQLSRSNRRNSRNRKLRFEGLEERRVLAVFHLLADAEDGAVGSLREALALANHNQEDDEIHLAPGRYDLALVGSAEDSNASGDLDFTEAGKSVTIVGAGSDQSIIDAALVSDRVLDVLSGVSLTLRGVAIRNGSEVAQGGGIRNAGRLAINDVAVESNSSILGGGIYNVGELAVDHGIVQNNIASDGGGLHNANGQVTIRDTQILKNSATGSRGQISEKPWIVAGNGGGLLNASGSVTLSSSVVAANSAMRSGGGIATAAGTMELLDTTVSDNRADFGGGIIVLAVTRDEPVGTVDPRFPWAAGKLQIHESVLTRNYASREGGGIRTSIGSQVEIVRSTISYNQAGTPESEPNGTGGGLNLQGLGSKVSIVHSTIAGNAAELGAGLFHTVYDTLEVGNSIIAGNRKLHSTSFKDHFIFKDLDAAYQSVVDVTSLGNNLIGNTDPSVTGFVDGVHGDVVGGNGNLPINPLLEPVVDDHGNTGTLAPIECSPAIEIGAGAIDGAQDSSVLNCGGLAHADWYTLSYGDFTLPVTANDGVDGDHAIAWLGEPSKGGELSLSADGRSVLYSPPADFRGVETFAYAIQGSSGSLEHAIVTVHVVDGLLARWDDHVTRRNSGASAVDVLSNDLRVESILGVPSILSVTPGDAGGETEIAVDGQSIMYTPPVDFVGEDSFEYTLAGGQSAKVRVRVYDPASPLQAPDRHYTILATPDHAGSAIGPSCSEDKLTCGLQEMLDGWNLPVLKNLVLGASIEVDLLTIDSVGQPDQGGAAGVVWNLNERWIKYRPRPGFTGLETIEYVTRDLEGQTSTGTITVNVIRVEDLARIRLEATDDSGNVIDSVRAGQQFQLRVMAKDLRPDDSDMNDMSALRSGMWFLADSRLRAVNSASVQIGFDSKVVSVAGEIEIGAPYADSALLSYKPLKRVSTQGVELAASAEWVRELDGQDVLFATIPLVAKASGPIAFTIQPMHGVGVFGYPRLPDYAVDYEGLSLNVIGSWRNENAPQDVNSDGSESPLDALVLINDLNEHGTRQLVSAEGEPSSANLQRPNYYPDVNNDGWLTPNDVLLVINHLNLNSQAAAAEGESSTELLEVADSETLPAANDRSDMGQLRWIGETSSLLEQPRRAEPSNHLVRDELVAAGEFEDFARALESRQGGEADFLPEVDQPLSEAESELLDALAIDNLTAKVDSF